MSGEAEPGPTSPRPRSTRLVLSLVAVVSSVAAAWSWSVASATDRPVSLPAAALHGLDTDQAACLQFGLVVRRSTVVDLTLALGKFQALDPDARPLLAEEIERVGHIAADYPEAHRRLVEEFGDVAGEGSAVLMAPGGSDYISAVSGRSGAIGDATDACLEVAGFDVGTLAVREAESP